MDLTVYWIVLGAIALAIVLVYNTLVRRRNAVDNAFASIDAYLMMRYDLIPNLVETVKGYAQHERETLQRVVEERRKVLESPMPVEQRVRLDNDIAHDMLRLFALAEAYPELRATENFQQLQRGLNEVEERLSAARRAFNAAVLDYNNAIEVFPLNLVASGFGFRRRSFFEAAAPERASPDVGARLEGRGPAG